MIRNVGIWIYKIYKTVEIKVLENCYTRLISWCMKIKNSTLYLQVFLFLVDLCSNSFYTDEQRKKGIQAWCISNVECGDISIENEPANNSIVTAPVPIQVDVHVDDVFD